MRFGLSLPAFGKYADPRALARLAAAAEDAGWDGFFIWDHIVFDPTFHPMADVWVALAAVAAATQHIKLGALVTSVSRRRPWKLARETVTLDWLSDGRLIFGAGLGEPPQWDFGWFGEETDPRIRAERLDEGLAIMTGLWSGELFAFEGKHYHLHPMQFLPKPLQQPRIPMWVGGGYDKARPLRRAAQYDGFFPLKFGENLTIDEWRTIRAAVAAVRSSDAPFDLIHGGILPDDAGEAAAFAASYAEIGVTWWVESADPWRWGVSWEEPLPDWVFERIEARVRQSPPGK